ncbi:MAG: hypothetical protein CMC70_11645 [Flavobacteriaceae bacterium]|nr:hypothetical protein [Flavobacteriaceae bacterium]
MEVTNTSYVENSGLILLSPFLKQYFEQLQYMADGVFLSKVYQNRALYLLQYLVYAHIDVPENALLLNKILVGMPLSHPVNPITTMTQDEIALSDSLLHGFISNWPRMEDTTPTGVQETFLQRGGIVTIDQATYSLMVERRGVDVLVQGIPWNFSVIASPWMRNPLHVTW